MCYVQMNAISGSFKIKLQIIYNINSWLKQLFFSKFRWGPRSSFELEILLNSFTGRYCRGED